MFSGEEQVFPKGEGVQKALTQESLADGRPLSRPPTRTAPAAHDEGVLKGKTPCEKVLNKEKTHFFPWDLATAI